MQTKRNVCQRKKPSEFLRSAFQNLEAILKGFRQKNYSFGNGGVVGAPVGASVGVVCEETFASDSLVSLQPTLLNTNATMHKLKTFNNFDTCKLLKMDCHWKSNDYSDYSS
jgi:hypothetical protein